MSVSQQEARIAGVDGFNWEVFADRQETQDNHIK